jgi:NTE family protein
LLVWLAATTLLIASGAVLVAQALSAGNSPVNRQIATANQLTLPVKNEDTDLWVGLAFSGGGTRASAFGQGMIEEIRAQSASGGDPDGLLSEVQLVTGVSGGSVTAAWFGLHGPAGVDAFRDTYLIQDAETYMAMSPWNPLTLARIVGGGANDRTTFARFLDEKVFHGATFGELARDSNITTWINATDLANNVTFLFIPETLDPLCADLDHLPLSEAVAASAAYPVVFSPIVVQAWPGTCGYSEPDWLTTARYNPESSRTMRAYARALEAYADPEKTRFLKLMDGGITDNLGTTGLAVERARAENPSEPLTPTQAVKLRRLLFLVSDAGVERHYRWTRQLDGPDGPQQSVLIARAAMASAMRSGYDAMRLELNDWHRDLIDYRCGLNEGMVISLRGSLEGWDCRDLKLFVGVIAFDDLDADLKARLDAVPTRLKLTEAEVDMVLEAGREATRLNPALNGFLRASGVVPPPRIQPGTGIQPLRR